MSGHGHHHHLDPASGDRRVVLAIAVNLGLTVAQFIGGILAGSLALVADALHNLSDAVTLVIAFAARRIARRPSDADMTFGYGRIEIVAALVNYTTLIVLGLWLAFEALMRFIEPVEVAGWPVVLLAGLALAVDIATALLTFALAKESLNIKAAFLHNVADALGSIAVILAGALILLFGWHIVDPLVTLLLAGWILWQAASQVGPVIRILMLGSPPGIEGEAVLARIRALDGVADVHHAHFWQMQEHESSLDAHIVIEPDAWPRAEAIRDAVRRTLREEFGIGHATLELELAANGCKGAQTFGHARKGEEKA